MNRWPVSRPADDQLRRRSVSAGPGSTQAECETLLYPPMTTCLGVPVRIRGTAVGNLYFTEKPGGVAFTDQDESLVGTLASAAGFVI
jgi:GAF domain-containing protein